MARENSQWLQGMVYSPAFLWVSAFCYHHGKNHSQRRRITVRHIILLAVLVMFTACEKRDEIHNTHDPDKPAEFFLISEWGKIRRYEYYVIANLPKKISEDEILALVEDYNRKTITVDMIKSHSIWRNFYRETDDLTRDYQEGAPYPRPVANYRYYGNDPGQQIAYHYNDFLIDILYGQASDGISTSFDYYHKGAHESGRKRILDINSYFANSDSKIVEE
jgi:hypothetical protein